MTDILEGISHAESEFNVTSMQKYLLTSNSSLLSRKTQNEHDVQYQGKDLELSKSETTEHIINVLSSTYIKTCYVEIVIFFAFIPVCNIDIFLEYFYLFHFMPQKVTT